MNSNQPESNIRPATVLGLFLALLGLGYFAYLCASIWPYTMDDSFISFRYARNLVQGHGLRFNPTDSAPAEGFTSALWLIAMVPAFLLRIPADIYAKEINLCFAIGTAVLIALSIREGRENERWSPLVGLLSLGGAAAYLCFFPVAIITVSGMETALSSFLACAGVFQVLRFNRPRGAGSYLLFAVTLLLMGLARPDLNLVALILLATAVRTSPEVSERRQLLRAGALYVCAGALYFGWRWSYFSSFLPLPFYIKGTGAGLQGLGSVLSFLTEPLIAALLLLSLGARRRMLGFLIAAIAYIVFFTKPVHLMGEGHRFLMPIVPLLIVTGFSTIDRVVHAASKRIVVVIATILLVMASAASLDRTERDFLNIYADGLKSSYGAMGLKLGSVKTTGTVAVSSVGLISYLSNWTVVDMFGLCNAEIAKHPDRRIPVIFASKPDFIMLASSSRNEYRPLVSQHRSEFNQAIYEKAVSERYRLTQVLEFIPGFYLFVLEK